MLNSHIGIRNAQGRARWLFGILTGVQCLDPWGSKPVTRAWYDARLEAQRKIARKWLAQRKVDRAILECERQHQVWKSLRSNVVAFQGVRR